MESQERLAIAAELERALAEDHWGRMEDRIKMLRYRLLSREQGQSAASEEEESVGEGPMGRDNPSPIEDTHAEMLYAAEALRLIEAACDGLRDLLMLHAEEHAVQAGRTLVRKEDVLAVLEEDNMRPINTREWGGR